LICNFLVIFFYSAGSGKNLMMCIHRNDKLPTSQALTSVPVNTKVLIICPNLRLFVIPEIRLQNFTLTHTGNDCKIFSQKAYFLYLFILRSKLLMLKLYKSSPFCLFFSLLKTTRLMYTKLSQTPPKYAT
jgi:hypothetical protein